MVGRSVRAPVGGPCGSGLPPVVILLIALAAAVLVCVPLGVTIERVAYRPLRRAPRLAPLITAIGVSILLQYGAALVWGKQYISMPGIFTPATVTFGGAQFTDMQAYIFLLACAVMGALLWFIKSSRVGRAMRATEQNPDVAGLMGVDTNRIIAFTFLLGSAIGALAGVMVVISRPRPLIHGSLGRRSQSGGVGGTATLRRMLADAARNHREPDSAHGEYRGVCGSNPATCSVIV